MAAPWTHGFYQSAVWISTAHAYMAHVDGLCERCRSRGLLVPAVLVHHRIHLTPENINDPAVSLAWANLEALCQDCHNKEHHRDQGPQRYAWGPDGSMIPS